MRRTGEEEEEDMGLEVEVVEEEEDDVGNKNHLKIPIFNSLAALSHKEICFAFICNVIVFLIELQN